MPAIDAHLHVWKLENSSYPWMKPPQWRILQRDIDYEELAPSLHACGIEQTMLVQADNTASDAEHIRAVALHEPTVYGFVGWVPLDRPEQVEHDLNAQAEGGKLVGIRHVLSQEQDDNWVLRPDVLRCLGVLGARGLAFDLNCDRPAFLRHVPELSRQHPGLRIVINHLGKPPIGPRGWDPWASDLATAAAFPNVFVKLSGLTTPVREGWSGHDFRRYVEHALALFGPDRMMYASNWPVTLVAGSYYQQWEATRVALGPLSESQRGAIFGGTAARCYRPT